MIRARYIILPQLLNGIAFLSSLYSTFTCEYVKAHYEYSWDPAETILKAEVGFGILAKETSALNSNQCYWYSNYDLNSYIYDLSFRTSVLASTLGSLLGGLNFLSSLFFWCRIVKRSTIRFVCIINVFCICSGIVTQMIFYSKLCVYETCQENGSDLDCVKSHCSFGNGTYFSILATILWAASLIALVNMLRRAEEQYRANKMASSSREETMKRNSEVEEGHTSDNIQATSNRRMTRINLMEDPSISNDNTSMKQQEQEAQSSTKQELPPCDFVKQNPFAMFWKKLFRQKVPETQSSAKYSI